MCHSVIRQKAENPGFGGGGPFKLDIFGNRAVLCPRWHRAKAVAVLALA
jgi:hypothetical protein